MTVPCAQEKVIKSLEKGQAEQGVKLDTVIENQHALSETIKDALDRLTSIIEADIGTRKDVEQGKKDIERLYDFRRKDAIRIGAIEIRNAKCDGLGVFNKWDTVYNFVQQEKGWRRFVPAAITVLCFLILIWDRIPE